MKDLHETPVKSPKDLSAAAREVQSQVLSSMRGSLEHVRYATPRVQLAWGRSREAGRIRHVNAVPNGLKSACNCPACGEELIARQGAVRAWHFAHHNGKECRNAVAASVCRFLAQWLSEGGTLDLPAVSYRYGGQRRERPARTGMRFAEAEVIENHDRQIWEVRARAQSGNRSSELRIIIRTNSKLTLPTQGDCRKDDVSTMVIDLGAVLSVALEIDPDLCTDEDWMTSQIISEAPRSWIWTKAADRLHAAEVEQRLRPLLDGISDAASKPTAPAIAGGVQDLVMCLGLGRGIRAEHPAARPDPIAGAFIFGQSPQSWRAEVLVNLVLKPIAAAFPQTPEYENTVIGWRQSGAICRDRKLVPRVFLRRIEPADLYELQNAEPRYAEPVKVIDAYLEELADLGVLRRRPRRRQDSWNSAAFDPGLLRVKGGSFSISESFIKDVHAHMAKHKTLRQCILQGRAYEPVE